MDPIFSSRWSAVLAASIVLATTAASWADGVSPMQAWKRSEVLPARTAGDFARLSALMKALEASVPDKAVFPRWAEWSRTAAEAAGRKDASAMNQACTDCHTAYRKTYQASFRNLPAPR